MHFSYPTIIAVLIIFLVKGYCKRIQLERREFSYKRTIHDLAIALEVYVANDHDDIDRVGKGRMAENVSKTITMAEAEIGLLPPYLQSLKASIKSRAQRLDLKASA